MALLWPWACLPCVLLVLVLSQMKTIELFIYFWTLKWMVSRYFCFDFGLFHLSLGNFTSGTSFLSCSFLIELLAEVLCLLNFAERLDIHVSS